MVAELAGNATLFGSEKPPFEFIEMLRRQIESMESLFTKIVNEDEPPGKQQQQKPHWFFFVE